MKNNEQLKKLKDSMPHGTIMFPFAIHQTLENTSSHIMLYTHWHDEFEILYITKGSMLLQIDTHSFVVKTGDIILVPPNEIHGATSHNNSSCDFYAIVFHPCFINSSLHDNIQINYLNPYFVKDNTTHYFFQNNMKEHILLFPYINSILQTYNTKFFGFELFIKSTLLQLFFLILGFSSHGKRIENADDTLSLLRMKKILSFLENNYQQPFSLADWSKSISLSKEQFSRVFKHLFHKTPVEYLLHYRIRKASDLLVHTNLPIIDIAFETGFNSPNYFAIAFKKIVSMSPKEYRSQHS